MKKHIKTNKRELIQNKAAASLCSQLLDIANSNEVKQTDKCDVCQIKVTTNPCHHFTIKEKLDADNYIGMYKLPDLKLQLELPSKKDK